MELMRQQAKNFGTRIVTDDIVEVDFQAPSVPADRFERRGRPRRRP